MQYSIVEGKSIINLYDESLSKLNCLWQFVREVTYTRLHNKDILIQLLWSGKFESDCFSNTFIAMFPIEAF